jgi:hypothetical protein
LKTTTYLLSLVSPGHETSMLDDNYPYFASNDFGLKFILLDKGINFIFSEKGSPSAYFNSNVPDIKPG